MPWLYSLVVYGRYYRSNTWHLECLININLFENFQISFDLQMFSWIRQCRIFNHVYRVNVRWHLLLEEMKNMGVGKVELKGLEQEIRRSNQISPDTTDLELITDPQFSHFFFFFKVDLISRSVQLSPGCMTSSNLYNIPEARFFSSVKLG